MAQGEAELFSTFADQRRMLLWHGSRVSNFCGIISQGLRIAPPEAPVTGSASLSNISKQTYVRSFAILLSNDGRYMFGKGVYFADLVSKSANYCNTSKASPIGLMLLCDVAVGDMNEK